MGMVLVPGLLAAGVGSLIYVGLDDWTGFGTFSLAVPDIPPVGSPTGAEFLWAIAIGILAAFLGAAHPPAGSRAAADRRRAEPRADPARGRRRSAFSP